MSNRVLRSLRPEHLDLLRPHLDEVHLPARYTVYRQGSAITNIFFIEAGVASLLTWAGTESIEVGMIGYEGVIGASALIGEDDLHPEVMMQVAGHGLRISVRDFKLHAASCPDLSTPVLRYLQLAVAQICFTSLSNGRGTVEKRLARWLLMAHDRLEGDEIPLTHEFLAVMLGVRRPGVTVALHVMEGKHAVRSRRNSIVIVDRDMLRAIAGTSYGDPERQYQQYLGIGLSKDRSFDAAAR